MTCETAATGGDAHTPPVWRLAALALLILPPLAGRVLARRTPAWLTALLAIVVPVALARPMIKASRRPPVEPATGIDGQRWTVTAIVTAQNERAVIGNLIADLGAQDLLTNRPDAFELIVIDDRSTDDTVDVVRRAAADAGLEANLRIVRTPDDGPRLKSAALASVPPETCRGDVIVHFDADARVDTQFLSTVLRYVAVGVRAMTARRLVLPRRGVLAAAQADDIAADGALLQGRWAAGGSSDFRGNGSIVTRELMIAVGGWPAALTEDIDLATRIATTHGVPIVWAREAVVWEEPVGSWPALWRQRVRWAEGVIRRTFRYAPEVARSRHLTWRDRVEFVLYAAQLTLPGVIAGAALGARRKRTPSVAVGLLSACAIFQAILAWHGLEDEPAWRSSKPGTAGRAAGLRRGLRAVRAALFYSIWLGTVQRGAWLIATRRGPVSFAKTRHFDSTFEGSGREPISLRP